MAATETMLELTPDLQFSTTTRLAELKAALVAERQGAHRLEYDETLGPATDSTRRPSPDAYG